jgi:hypothetical protein
MSSFQDAIRCVITDDGTQEKSVVIIDGGPLSELGSLESGGFLKFGKMQPLASLIFVCTTILGQSILCWGHAKAICRYAGT